MKRTARTCANIAALAVFAGLPLLFYALGEAPRRSTLKELISILTLLAFSMMLGQFFLVRSNQTLLGLFEPAQVQKVHKVIAYAAVGVILLHPALVVLPRYFEAGVKPWDAFITLITTLDNLGVLVGLAAWFLLLLLTITAFFRKPLIPRFTLGYRGWRYFHGGFAVTFTALAIWHAMELGRHTDLATSVFFLTLALLGFALLARLYWGAPPVKPVSSPVSEGAST